MVKYLIGGVCGALVTGVVGYLAALWYLKDVFR